MQEEGAVFGGEGNGGVIDPEIHYGRDSLVGIMHIINLLRRTGKTMSELVAALPHYEMRKIKFPVVAGTDYIELYDRIAAGYPEAVEDRRDGLRLSWSDKWVHVRPSNTEPIMRIIAEAPTAEVVDQLVKQIQGLTS